ncbi:ATP-grasp domain-containing protein [Actinomadura nitritigenes]|uniref:ATP-grasp domain-containing protein n=1 Tax=Actinomadura nitritigenes TaxID=134602 RepID=UPI003D8E0946
MTASPLCALATCAHLPEGGDDARMLAAALTGLGVAADIAVWDDPAVDWSRYDLVVVRSTWDYTDRRDGFLAWAESLPRVLNPADVLRWNTDKRYLRDLEAAGVPVVPTRWDPDGIPADWPEYVLKPSVSSGSRDTARWGPGEEDAARAHLRDLRAAGRTVMLQPYLEAVDTAGETALVFLGGEYSHAGRKARVLNPGAGIEGLAGLGESRGRVTAATATDAELDLAHRVLDAVPGGRDLLYARVDLIPGPDGDPLLIELELTEPALYLEHAPGSDTRFAKAVAALL